MRMTEAHIRKIIRQELLKEMGMGDMPSSQPPQEETKLHAGPIAGGLATGGALGALVGVMNYVQTHPIGHDIAMKIKELSDAVQSAMEE
jgi:hypothetical protein